jgi:hypothetical protein
MKDEEAIDWREGFPQLPLDKDNKLKEGSWKTWGKFFFGVSYVESHKAPVSLRIRPRAQDSRSRAETPNSAVELDDSIARLVGP